VLVNISASEQSFELQEMYDVMETVKAFAAESATVIVGTVYDETLSDDLRVTWSRPASAVQQAARSRSP